MQTRDQDQHTSIMLSQQPELPPGWQPGIPLVRLFTCGRLRIELLREVPDGDAAQARYVELPPERLQGRGPGPALTVLKLLISQPERAASKDWLMSHLRQDEQEVTRRRMENIVSCLRGLLCLPTGQRIPDVLLYVRASAQSGDGYRLADYPLVWLDTDALAWQVKRACLLEHFQDDAFPHWQRAYQLASRGTYLLEAPYSQWAQPMRERVEGYLRQSVHALSRLLLARHGEAGEEEVIRLLRDYWLGHPQDEDALWPLLELLGKHGCYQEALQYYDRLCEVLQEQGLTKGGHKREPDQRTRELADYLRIKQRRSLRAQPVVALPGQADQQAQAALPMPVPPIQPSLAHLSGAVLQQVLQALFPFQQGLTLPGDLSAAVDLAVPGVWVARGAGYLGQVFEAGWSSQSILATMQIILDTLQAMPASIRHQLVSPGAPAYLNGMPLPVGSQVTEEERVQLTNALGKWIGESWQCFQTTGSAQMLALGQTYLFLIQQTHALLDPPVRPYLYAGAYGIIGLAMHFLDRHQEALQAHHSAYLAALATGDPWYVAQSLICQSDAQYALRHYDTSLQMIEEALRLLANPLNDAQVRAKAHLLTCWADNAMTVGAYALAQEKLEASRACLGQLGLDLEFDHAGWLLIAGKYALVRGKNEIALHHFKQALAELPEQWTLRRTMTALGLAMAYARIQERERSLRTAEDVVPMLQIVNAPMIDRWFVAYLEQDLCPRFSTDTRVQTFLTDTCRRLPHVVPHFTHTG